MLNEEQPKKEDVKKEEIQPQENEDIIKGVVYLPRIPPFMTPSKFSKMFGEYGVERVYFIPIKGKRTHTAEEKNGGKAQLYKEGWAEFSDKKTAKKVALLFNNTSIGGKKRHNMNREDLWLIKYLPKFKWDYLTEKKMYNQKVREQRMRAEDSQNKREMNYYIGQTLKKKKYEEPKQIN